MTKIHAAVNALGNLVRLIITADYVLADKGYDSDAFLVDRLLRKLTYFRRVATRYERLGRNYLGILQLAAFLI